MKRRGGGSIENRLYTRLYLTRGSHSHAERPCLRTFHATQRGSLCQDVAEGSSGAHLL